MKKLKPWLLLALVFLVGVMVGVVGTRFVVRRAVRQAMLHPARVELVLERRLTRRLQLDAGQQAQLEQILQAATRQLQTLRQQYHPAATGVYSNANAQFSAILNPEQQLKYERWKAENAPLLRGLQSAP